MIKQLVEIKHRHRETKKGRNSPAILNQIQPQTLKKIAWKIIQFSLSKRQYRKQTLDTLV